MIKRSPFIRINQVAALVFFLTFFVGTSAFAQLQFIQNKGQWDSHVQYKSDIPNGAFFIEKNGYTVLEENAADMEAIEERMHGHINDSLAGRPLLASAEHTITTPAPLVLRGHVYKVSFIGASENAQGIPEKSLDTYNNYFIGNDTTRWAHGCGLYQSITYQNIYPNIDIHYYTNAGTLKYDLIIHPGGHIEDVKLKYDGVDKLAIKDKELTIGTSVGESKELYPYTYQLQADGRKNIHCKYSVKDNIVSFKIDEYDPTATMVIDPTLIFSTLTGSRTDNWGFTATPGPDGSFFAGGTAFDNGYPVSPGAFQTTFHGGVLDGEDPGYDMAIIKYSADGSKRLYATYLGGNGDEQPHSMICDAAGELIVAGRTNSGNFPVRPAAIANQGPHGGYDIVVTKFTADGTAIIGSVVIGGEGDDGVNIASKEKLSGANQTNRNYGDDARSEILLDNNNNVYLASCTQSTKFPIINTGIQTVYGGNQDGVVMEFTPNLSTIVFSTYFGGTGADACFVLAMSPITGNLYVGGGTTSPTLQGDTTNVIAGSFQGGSSDGFVTELRSDGSAIIKTVYTGTKQDDLVYGLKIDNDGFPYIMGTTTGTWPVTPLAAYSQKNGKQFIAKLMPDLSSYIYSTIFGTNSALPNISPVAFLVDRCENVYVSGWGGSFDSESGYPNAGTSGLVPTANAIKSVTDGNDFYFYVLGKDASGVLFSSFFGQQGGFNDHVDGGTSRFDGNGIIYQAICANCNTGGAVKGAFPTTPGAWSRVNPAGGFGCNEAGVKIEMNFAGVGALIKTEIDGVPYDTTGCLPLTVNFYDTLSPAQRYFWNFGDGTAPDTTATGVISHTFNSVGWFRVMLIAEDSLKCNIRDTAYRNIKVSTNLATLAFSYAKAGSCDSLNYQFNNNSVAAIGSFSSKGFIWDYHDGSPNDTLGIAPHFHTFPSPGSYDVSLCVIDTFICNAPDCVDSILNIASNVVAKFITPPVGCAPYNASFTNTSIGGTNFVWDFGDGSPVSNAYSPTHTYITPGQYIVQLVTNDLNTCNKTDTTTDTINVYSKPTAAFSFGPAVAKLNTPTQFTNASIGATHYVWNFGDGNTLTDINPSYQFNSSGTFHVCLQAINDIGCIDTACADVDALVDPLFDVPNAFTPGSGGINSIIKVQAYGINKFDWKIYNRWGQLVFESTSVASGWDGTFNGTPQPTEVYTYTLDIGLINGKEYKKTGDITLLR